MELDELIMLGACAIIASDSYRFGPERIQLAVKLAKLVWQETLRATQPAAQEDPK